MEQNGKPIDPEPIGVNIAAEMLKNVVRLNENIERSHKIQSEILESLQDLADYHETYMRAMEILIEKSEEGKSKFSLADLARATAEAAEEVMGEEEDEPGPEDPLVDIRR